VKSPAKARPAIMPTLEQLGATSDAWGMGVAAGAPRDREAIVTLLALMLRGLLKAAPRAGANA
jgi:hypothetical protein